MIQFSPRFFVLPLIAFAVIVSLPRSGDTSTVSNASVGNTLTCASSPSTPCVAAATSRSVVR